MSKTTTEHKKTRTRYSQQYKDEALALAERVGMSKAAAQLGLKEAQLLCLAHQGSAGHEYR